MVCDWKPNCSRELNDPRMPEGGPSVPDHTEDNGLENEVDMVHYQLLPSDMQQGLESFPVHANDTSDSDEESDDSDEFVQANDSTSPSSDESPDTGQTTQHKLEGWERTEISVNSDEIRSLMRGFSLPDSAVPEWASSVPESSFTSFVWDRIKPK